MGPCSPKGEEHQHLQSGLIFFNRFSYRYQENRSGSWSFKTHNLIWQVAILVCCLALFGTCYPFISSCHSLLDQRTQASREQRLPHWNSYKSASWLTQTHHCPTVAVSLQPNISAATSVPAAIFATVFNPQVAVRLSDKSASNSSLLKLQAKKYASADKDPWNCYYTNNNTDCEQERWFNEKDLTMQYVVAWV